MKLPALSRGKLTPVLGTGGLVALVIYVALVDDPVAAKPDPATVEAASPPSMPEMKTPPWKDYARGHERHQELVARFPPYPNSVIAPMGELSANGVPMQLGHFTTNDSLERVLSFYEREFQKQFRRPQRAMESAMGGSVSYYDAKTGELVSITARTTQDRHPTDPNRKQLVTFVFPSVSNAEEGIQLAGKAPPELPQLPGLVTVMRVDDNSGTRTDGSITLTQTAPGSPVLLRDAYLKQMTLRGYTVTEHRSQKDVEWIQFESSQRKVMVSISPFSKGVTDTVQESTLAVVMENQSQHKVQTQ